MVLTDCIRLVDAEKCSVSKTFPIDMAAFTTWMSPDGALAAFQSLQLDLTVMDLASGNMYVFPLKKLLLLYSFPSI